MASISCSLDYVVDLHKQIAVLTTKLQQAVEEKTVLERAAAYYMSQNYLGSSITSSRQPVAQIVAAVNQESSNSSMKEPSIDLLTSDENTGSSDLGIASTAADTGATSVESSPVELKHDLEAQQKLAGNIPESSGVVDYPVKPPVVQENLLLAQDKLSRPLIEGIKQQSGPSTIELPRPRPATCDFDHWGIQYAPITHIGTSLRVLMTNLPKGTTLGALMEHIRGGSVVDCLLLDTARLMGGTWSALVRFRDPGAAEALEKRYHESPLAIGGRSVTVTLIQTPSYPLPSPMRLAVYSYGRTRCLRMGTEDAVVRQSIGDALQRAGLMLPHVLEAIEEHPSGHVDIRFASVWYAQRAMDVIWRPTGAFREVWHIEDPCARPFPQPAPRPKPKPEAKDKKAADLEDPEEVFAAFGLKHWAPPDAATPDIQPTKPSEEALV